MKKFWSGRIQDMVPYTPGEQPRDKRFVKLNTNENPYPPSKAVLEAIREAADGTLRLYPDPECVDLRNALAKFYGLAPNQIFVGNGSDEVLAFCFQAFFTPGNPIAFADVTYSFYPVFANLFGQEFREIPLDENFGLPVKEFLGGNGGVVLANPNAPTGREISLCDIREIVEGNPDVVVLVDEAYVDFGARSAVELIKTHPNLVVVHTMSKSRGLAGLRVGYALGDANLIAALNCVKNSFNSYTLDRLAQAGAKAALQDNDYFKAVLAKVTNTRDATAFRLEHMGFHVYESSANFLFITHEKVAAKTLLDSLRERGFLVRWWDKPRISNCLRVSIGTEEDMDAFCKVMEDLVKEYLPSAVL